MRRRRARRVLPLMLVTALGLATVSGLSPAARTVVQATTSGPTVTVTPNSNVVDGEYLVVSFRGFGPGQPFDFRQCIATPAVIATDCTPPIKIASTPVTAVADNHGNGSTYIPVYSGADQFLANDGATGPITCDTTHPCVVALMPNPADLSTAVLVPITLAPAANLCPSPGANAVVGSGSATAYRAIYQWEAAVCQPPASLPVSYALKNSPDGVLNFLTGTTAFGVTGPWAPDYAPVSTATPPQTWAYAPITMSAMVLAYRMYDLRGPQITTLKLTTNQIARIFTGSLNNLATDTGVTALNPKFRFPGILNVFARSDHSAESWVFTSWLSKVEPSVWTFGPEEIFPAASGVGQATGSNAIALDVLTNPNSTFSGQGTMGFMDSSTAAYYGLPTVSIVNADGTTTSATPGTIARAVTDATLNADGTVTPGAGDQTAWPMLLPTYLMVPTNNVTPVAGKVIADFLRFAVQGGQSATTLPQGYAPLTGSMVGASLLAADAIPVTVAAPTPPPAVVLGTPAPSITNPVPNLPALPPVPAAVATAAPAPSATAAPSIAQAIVQAPPLALATDSSPMFLPITAGFAALALIVGLAVQAVDWLLRRRRRASASQEPS